MPPHLCPICYDEITAATGEVRMSCTHAFHLNCIGTWLQAGRDNCPCCRAVVQASERLAPVAAPAASAAPAYVDNLIPITRNQIRNTTFIVNRDDLRARHPEFIFFYYDIDGTRVDLNRNNGYDQINNYNNDNNNDNYNHNGNNNRNHNDNGNNNNQVQFVANNIPIQ